MKKLILLIIIILLLSSCSPINDGYSTSDISTTPTTTRFDTTKDSILLKPSIKIGMSQKQIESIENIEVEDEYGLKQKSEIEENEPNLISYNPSSRGLTYYYSFTGNSNTTNKLQYYLVTLNPYHEYDKCIEYYNDLKSKIILIYGKPTTEQYIWNNEFYKNDSSKLETAFEKSHVSIECLWKTKHFVININWRDARHRELLYISNDYYNKKDNHIDLIEWNVD